MRGHQGGTDPEKGLALTRFEMERYLEEENLDVKAAVTIVISDGHFNPRKCMKDDTWLRQYGPVFYVFMTTKEGALEGTVNQVRAVLKETHGTLGCKNCVVDFAPSVGQGGTVTGFAGALVEMCQANAGEAVDCGSYNE